MDAKAIENMKKQINAMEHFFQVSTLKDLELSQLFYPEFMLQQTYSKTIWDFLAKGGFDVKCIDDFSKLPKEKLDEYIFEETGQYKSWEEFLLAAREFWLEHHV